MVVSTRTTNDVLGYSIFLLFQINICTAITEAVTLPSQLIKRSTTNDNVTFTLPLSARCSGHFSQLCIKEVENELYCHLSAIEYNEVDKITFDISRLQPNTSYILKSENESLMNCSIEIRTNSDKPPVLPDFNVKAVSRGFCLTCPPQEMCQNQNYYFLRYKSNDTEYTNWTEVKIMSSRKQENCLLNVYINLNEKHLGGMLSVQVQARRAGERVAQGAGGPGPRGALWLRGLWTVLGAVSGLATATLLSACYFNRRVKSQDVQTTGNDSSDSLSRTDRLNDLLVPDIDVLIDCEIIPEDTEPATETKLPTPELNLHFSQQVL